MNIVLVIIDALRVRNVSSYGYALPTTPYLDRLAANGVLFENAFACANATIPSLTTILSGLYPLSHGIARHRPLAREEAERGKRLTLLPEVLSSAGYQTAGVDILGLWLSKGYDHYLTPKPYDARTVSSAARDLINNVLRPPFFLMTHFWDTHMGYNPGPGGGPFAGRAAEYPGSGISTQVILDTAKNPWYKAFLTIALYGTRTFGEVMARYDGAISAADTAVGEILACLENNGYGSDTLILVTGDHGESLLEHGIYFDHHGLYDVSIHVPLIALFPGLGARGIRKKALVQHTDIVPTVMEMIGLPWPGAKPDGKSLLPLIHGRLDAIRSAAYSVEATYEDRHSIRTLTHHYIVTPQNSRATCQLCEVVHGSEQELFDLAQDPVEVKNLAGLRPQLAGALAKALAAWSRHTGGRYAAIQLLGNRAGVLRKKSGRVIPWRRADAE